MTPDSASAPGVESWSAMLVRRGPALTLLLAAAALAAGSSPELELDRRAVADGQLWRLATGHFVHYGRAHAVGDIVGFLGWSLVIEAVCRRLLVRVLAASIAGVSVGVLVFCPQVRFYGGLSAIDVALATSVLCVLASSERVRALPGGRLLVGLVLAAHVFKAAYEVLIGRALLAPDLGDGVMLLPAAHLFGAACGAAAWWCWRRSEHRRRFGTTWRARIPRLDAPAARALTLDTFSAPQRANLASPMNRFRARSRRSRL